MAITQTGLYPPNPATRRGALLFLSYDGARDRIAYVSGKTVVVRPLGSGDALHFTRHNAPATAASFSPSGNWVASGDEHGNVFVWDATGLLFEQPKVKSEFQVLGGPIRLIAWDGDGQRLIAVGSGKDKFGHCFSWDLGNTIGEIQGHSETVNAVDIRKQRPYRAATVGDDKALVFYVGPPFKFDKSVRGTHSNSVRDVKFSPDGQWLVSVGSDRVIAVYDGKSGDLVKHTSGHDGGIYSVAWWDDSLAFVTASADGTLRKWSPALELQHTYGVAAQSWGDQQAGVVVAGLKVVLLSLGGQIHVFGAGAAETRHGHQRALTAVATHEGHLVTGGDDGSLLTWKLEHGALAAPQRLAGHDNYVVSIVGGSVLASVGWDDKLRFWGDAAETVSLDSQPKQAFGDVVVCENSVYVHGGARFALPFSASCGALAHDKVLVNNLGANRVEEFSREGTHLRSFPALRAPPTLIAVSPSGEYAAVAENTGKYTLYKVADMSVVTTRWAFHSSRVFAAAWTADSQHLVSGGLDCGLFVYSVARPSKVLKLPLAHQGGVTGLAWLDTTTFASTGLDGAVKTWLVDLSQ